VGAALVALTPLGDALKKVRRDRHGQRFSPPAGPIGRQAWDRLLYSLRTGKPGFTEALGRSVFEDLAEHPEEVSLFSETMVSFHGAEPPAVAAAYDFDAFASIVDVGGATGNMLVHILKRYACARGILFDLPHVVAEAPAFLASHGMTTRVSVVTGSFFETVPAGHDAYLLSHVIHDWDEDQCQTILRNCRRAIDRNGRLLIVETVLPEGDTPHPGKMLDMMMLVGPGGQERTPNEYREMLSRAGFQMTRVVPTTSDVSIVEAVPI
jgi:hypothetical protein